MFRTPGISESSFACAVGVGASPPHPRPSYPPAATVSHRYRSRPASRRHKESGVSGLRPSDPQFPVRQFPPSSRCRVLLACLIPVLPGGCYQRRTEVDQSPGFARFRRPSAPGRVSPEVNVQPRPVRCPTVLPVSGLLPRCLLRILPLSPASAAPRFRSPPTGRSPPQQHG